MIDRSARAVRKQYPDAVLSVGHLSKNGGGEVDRHASHESGRDADIGFYVRNAQGKTIYADHMVAFTADGTAPTWPGAHFDDAKNWALVSAMVTDPATRITHLFVATPIRERLLAYAAKIGAPMAIRVKASEVLAQPRGSLPHDDHFHVRIACPTGMDKCIEQPLAKKKRPNESTMIASAKTSSSRGRAHSSNGTGRTSSHAAPPAPAVRAKPAPTAPAAPPAPERETTAKSDAIPNLGEDIPGLDSAVISAPLTGLKPPSAAAPSPPPAEAPIDDPDGVLEGR
jgi:penicillin-insensitive murein endopeptidase